MLAVAVTMVFGEQGFTPVLASEVAPVPVRILKIEGPTNAVQVLRPGAANWEAAHDNQVLPPGWRLRTLDKGRLTLRWSDNTTVPVGPFSDAAVESSPDPRQPGLRLLKGLLSFFHRDRPTVAWIKTRTASAAIRGTEFVLEVIEPEGRTILSVVDGKVELSNLEGQVTNLVSGEQGIVEPGKPLRKTALIEVVNVVQWRLYYPGVLDPDEVGLNSAEQQALEASLTAYRQGDLLEALAQYPADRVPASDAETVYRAAVLLAVGQVDRSAPLLNAVSAREPVGSHTHRLAEALKRMIAAVKLQPPPSTLHHPPSTMLASEWLAESYSQQSRSKLPEALLAARRAVTNSPRFGLAQTRVAELEFCFGRTREALAALELGLQLSPRNAQAWALKGFLLAAQNQIPAGLACFEQAITLDGGLGNAWLGRGLCKIRQGRIKEGRDDLQVAATVEPQRALLRSYLAKSYSAARDNIRAGLELQRALDLDLNDPTAWLYSALLHQQENRINDAVRDLEKSQELNENRSVYRSRLLLDRDTRMRGANLASVYRDAELFEVATRQAARAVSVSPADYSAHLFLANAYYEMLDPHQHYQRYESARVNEYLTATLLAPVGAGLLSQPVSAQEYSRFFERDGLGVFANTEYLSRGAAQQYGAQYGRFGNLSYAVEAFYRWDPGQRPNNDLEQSYTSAQWKQQLTIQDSVFLQAVLATAKYGDLSQVSDPTQQGSLQVRNKETQEPLLLLGYHREWAPGSHSLVLAGRLADTLRVSDPGSDVMQNTFVVSHNAAGQVTGVLPYHVGQEDRSQQEVYGLEAQHILEKERFALIGGGRWQVGSFATLNTNSILGYINAAGSVLSPAWFQNPAQDCRPDFERCSVYGYGHLQVLPPLRLIAGLSYDWLQYPENFRFVPVSSRESSTDQVSPKGGVIWTPFKDTTVRGAYSRSVGGASLDQSFLLEPSQVAGFNQLWRSLIPESVGGANAGATYESWNVSYEQRCPTRTYLGVGGEILRSDVNRVVGGYDLRPRQFGVFPVPPFIFQAGIRQRLAYEERSLLLTANQLVGEGWNFGARYRLSQAELNSQFPDIPASATTYGGFMRQTDQAALLHQVSLSGGYAHRCGLFAEAQTLWMKQDNDGYTPSLPGDDFWQVNLFAGYRFPRRQAQVRVGLLNLTGQDYRLNPLNLTGELPRTRTMVLSFRFSF